MKNLFAHLPLLTIEEDTNMHELFKEYADRFFANDEATRNRILESIEQRRQNEEQTNDTQY